MADEKPPVIIKRIKKSAAGHHGGAWKVAYADFVTAMMAFFLLLWLLNAVTEEQKQGIANYFKPTLATSPNSSDDPFDGTPQVIAQTAGGASESTEQEDEDEAETSSANQEEEETEPVEASDNGVPPVDIQQAEQVVAQQEAAKFEEIKQQIQTAIRETPDLKDLEQNLLIEQTEEGLRIQLIDREKISMFPSGSAVMNQRSQELLKKVAQAIDGLPNKLAISGHTDASPYSGSANAAGYSNWELSTDRANASRRVLVDAGIDVSRLQTVNGKAETDPLMKDDPLAPQNRRISIVLLREPRPQASASNGGSASAAPREPPSELIPPEVAPPE